MAIALAIHLLAVVIWVGGMFFAYMALRPAAVEVLEPPLRLALWAKTFDRFFRWVWVSIALITATGYWMIISVMGGFATVGLYVHLMQGLGILMILLFLHLFFSPFKRMKGFIEQQDFKAAGQCLAQIRKIVAVNLCLGLAIIALVIPGKMI